MTWLALRIFGYLLAAGLVGAVTGWLLSRLARRDRWQVQLVQARAEAFDLRNQLERQARQVEALRERLAQLPEERLPPADDVSRPTELADRETGSEVAPADLQTQLAASEDLIRALHQEIVRLRLAAEGAAVAPKVSPALELTVKDLEGRLVRKMAELDRLQQALTSEEKKVRDLERERELQNKSLLVLNQQLEMERKPQRAAG